MFFILFILRFGKIINKNLFYRFYFGKFLKMGFFVRVRIVMEINRLRGLFERGFVRMGVNF